MEKLETLLRPVLGGDVAQAMAVMAIPDIPISGDGVDRAEFSVALTVALHWGLLQRVPTGRAYVADSVAAGRKVVLDHGALRTVLLPGASMTGAIPGGAAGFAPILEPLGYVRADRYPLDRLKMTGYAWCHRDHPDSIAQYFISELHVDRFDAAFQAAAIRTFGATREPLDAWAREALDRFASDGAVPVELAARALPSIVGAFDRLHPLPSLGDYEILKAASAEAAWIATEGNAFNHGTDRVADVDALADGQRALGRPMKDRIEISGSGRVRQTAYRADWVERRFIGDDGAEITLTVPGSFYEFISRDIDPETGKLDLRFDSGNAQGIFKMTAALDA